MAKTKRPTPKQLIIAGVAALAVIALIVWAVVSGSAAARENAIKSAAQSFVTAIADADADAALDLLAERPANTALLTDDVLAASQREAHLTEVEVTSVTQREQGATVAVSYQLGTERVDTQLDLVDAGNSWKVTDGTANLDVPDARGITVNGAALTENVNPAFPGTYVAAPVSDVVTIEGESRATIKDPAQEGATLAVTPALSESGREKVVTTVKTRFEECLAEKVSRPANCPFGFGDENVEITPDSVQFTLVNDPWPDFPVDFDPARLLASGLFHYEVNADATVTQDGLTAEATLTDSTERAYEVDLTQDPPTLAWR